MEKKPIKLSKTQKNILEKMYLDKEPIYIATYGKTRAIFNYKVVRFSTLDILENNELIKRIKGNRFLMTRYEITKKGDKICKENR